MRLSSHFQAGYASDPFLDLLNASGDLHTITAQICSTAKHFVEHHRREIDLGFRAPPGLASQFAATPPALSSAGGNSCHSSKNGGRSCKRDVTPSAPLRSRAQWSVASADQERREPDKNSPVPNFHPFR